MTDDLNPDLERALETASFRRRSGRRRCAAAGEKRPQLGALIDHFAQALTLRNGKIVRIQAYPSFDTALEAAGLTE